MALVQETNAEAIEIKLPCKPEYVRMVRRVIAEFAISQNMSSSIIEEIEIATSEAVANTIRHAYPNSKDVPQIRVKCSYREQMMIVEVIDKGCGFNAPQDDMVPEVDFERDGGFGIILIKRLMDRVNYVSKANTGTRIKMAKFTRDNAMKVKI